MKKWKQFKYLTTGSRLFMQHACDGYNASIPMMLNDDPELNLFKIVDFYFSRKKAKRIWKNTGRNGNLEQGSQG